ncbi:MAG: hypothetical protein KKA60_02960 [Proteobacteria bacterium]|nr:hypothetical protein [Pseudomonadota bacterium]
MNLGIGEKARQWASATGARGLNALIRGFPRHPGGLGVDILVFHPMEISRDLRRWLGQHLEEEGLSVAHHSLETGREMLGNWSFVRSGEKVPARLYPRACHARYLILKYRPRLVVTFMDASYLSILLRREANRLGARVVNISHGVTAASPLFSVFDFDYYFLFGPSSVDHCFENPVRYGSTRLLVTGSPSVDTDLSMPVNSEKKQVLFFSSWLPDSVRDILLRNMEIAVAWARENPGREMLVKTHPLEDVSIITRMARGVPNIRILPPETTMAEVLKPVSLSLVMWSNASLESALANRPCVVVNDSDMDDSYLGLETFFGPRARNSRELEERVSVAFSRYDELLDNTGRFVARHLAHPWDAREEIVRNLKTILSGQEPGGCIPIQGTRDYFEDFRQGRVE